MPAPRRIGIAGTGAIGAPLAINARKHGIETSAFDIDRSALEPLAAQGVALAQSNAELASSCDVVVTCVTDPAAVEDAILGTHGIAAGAQPGTLIIEMSTSTPSVTRRIDASLAARDIAIVDAPVSRGVAAAMDGTLSIMVGGDAMHVARALATLRMFGTDIIQTGALGSGHIAKALNMSVLGANFLALAEIMALGEALGFDPSALCGAINASDAASFVSQNHYVKYVLPGRFESRFTYGLMKKDVSIAAEIANETRLLRPFLHRVIDFYDSIAERDFGEDNTNLFPKIAIGHRASWEPMSEDNAGSLQEVLILALATAHLLATQEGVATAQAAGLAPDIFLQVLNTSSGGSRMSERCFNCGRAVACGWRGARAAEALGRTMHHAVRCEIAMPLIALTRDVILRAEASGPSDRDTALLARSIWNGE